MRQLYDGGSSQVVLLEVTAYHRTAAKWFQSTCVDTGHERYLPLFQKAVGTGFWAGQVGDNKGFRVGELNHAMSYCCLTNSPFQGEERCCCRGSTARGLLQSGLYV